MATEAVENLAADFLQWLDRYSVPEQRAILIAVWTSKDLCQRIRQSYLRCRGDAQVARFVQSLRENHRHSWPE
jgi:hypothetical protein